MFETKKEPATASAEGTHPGTGRCDPPGWLRAALRVLPGADQAGFAELEAPVLTAGVAGLARLESRVAP